VIPFANPLVALSLTDPDVGLLHYARMLAGAGLLERVRFVHVLPSEQAPPRETQIAEVRERMQREVREHFGDSRTAGDSIAVLHGPRLDRLLEYAAANRHDLILLGHRRERSGRRSLARRLAMSAPCSVWLVPEGAEPRLDGVLAPVDFSPPSADALSVATAIAAGCGRKLCLALHVFFDPSTVRYDEHIAEVRGNERDAFRQFVAGIDTHGVTIEPLFEESTHADQAILRVAQRHGVDLIVMATRGRSRAAAVLLGSTTSSTLAITPVPLLAVKHFGSRMSLVDVLLDQRSWKKTGGQKTN